jgi:hypothetical protein
MPFPVVFFHISQGSGSSALGRDGMGPGGVNLGKNRGIHVPAGLQGCIKAGNTRPHDDYLMFMNHFFPPLFHSPQSHREYRNLNPKFEYRNPKQTQNPNSSNNSEKEICLEFLSFGIV